MSLPAMVMCLVRGRFIQCSMVWNAAGIYGQRSKDRAGPFDDSIVRPHSAGRQTSSPKCRFANSLENCKARDLPNAEPKIAFPM